MARTRPSPVPVSTYVAPQPETLMTLGDCHFTRLSLDAKPSVVLPHHVEGAIMLDCETSGLHPDDGSRVSVVSVAWLTPEMDSGTNHTPLARPRGTQARFRYTSAAFPFGQGPDCLDLGPHEWEHLTAWLTHAGAGVVGHNIKFDTLQLAGQTINGYPGVDLTRRVLRDTMISQYEITPTGRLALKIIATKLWDEDADAEQRALGPHLGTKADPRYDLIPWPVMHPYAARDVELTAALFNYQEDWFDESTALGGWVGQEHDVNAAIARMELAGVPYPPDTSLEAAKVLTERISTLADGLPFKPTPHGSAAYFYDTLKIKPTDFTETGRPSAAAPVIKRLATLDVPHAAELSEHNALKSGLSKWYIPFAERAGADRRIRSSIRHTGGTKSGRLSASRINLQAVPKDYALMDFPVPTPRQLIAQEVEQNYPGWQLWDIDLQQAELRLAAMDSDVKPMLTALSEKRDLHSETAKQLFKADPSHDDWDSLRHLAKTANFSLIFGAGPKTFHKMLLNKGTQITYTEVRDIVYGWRDLYPGFASSIEREQTQCDLNGYVTLLTGRRRFYLPGEDTRSAMNQKIQGSLADMAKLWTIDTDRRLSDYPKRGLDAGIGRAGLLLTVHDSQVLLLPDGEADQVVAEVVQSAADIWDRLFPGVPGGADASRWA